MTNWHIEAVEDDLLVAELVDQGLASLRLRVQDDYPRELRALIEHACDAWDEVADALPRFRDDG